MMESQEQKLMRVLGITQEEAKEVIKYDSDVDKMKVVKQARQADRKPTVYKFTKRERKTDDEKANLIAEIANFLEKFPYFETKSVEIVKEEREISFQVGVNNYSLTLTKHRK
jgi:seryl-tRNA synthetase